MVETKYRLEQTNFRFIHTKYRLEQTNFRFVQPNCRLEQTHFRFVQTKYRSEQTKIRAKFRLGQRTFVTLYQPTLTKFRRNLNNRCPKNQRTFADISFEAKVRLFCSEIGKIRRSSFALLLHSTVDMQTNNRTIEKCQV